MSELKTYIRECAKREQVALDAKDHAAFRVARRERNAAEAALSAWLRT